MRTSPQAATAGSNAKLGQYPGTLTSHLKDLTVETGGTMAGGTVVTDAAFTLNGGSYSWSGGKILLNGNLVGVMYVLPAATLTVNAPAGGVTLGAQLNNQGTVNLQGSGSIYTTGFVETANSLAAILNGGGTINLNPGAGNTLNMQPATGTNKITLNNYNGGLVHQMSGESVFEYLSIKNDSGTIALSGGSLILGGGTLLSGDWSLFQDGDATTAMSNGATLIAEKGVNIDQGSFVAFGQGAGGGGSATVSSWDSFIIGYRAGLSIGWDDADDGLLWGGTLNIKGDVFVYGGVGLEWNGGSGSQLNVTGAVTLSNGSVVSLEMDINPPAQADGTVSWTSITATGGVTADLTKVNISGPPWVGKLSADGNSLICTYGTPQEN